MSSVPSSPTREQQLARLPKARRHDELARQNGKVGRVPRMVVLLKERAEDR